MPRHRPRAGWTSVAARASRFRGRASSGLSMWRRDAAGNEAEDNASVPVTLRYDPEPPQLAFEPPPAGDPTLVAVQASDRSVSRAWRTGRSRSARPDRAAGRRSPPSGRATACSRGSTTPSFPPGTYALRARAADQAGNEASTDRRVDGQPMLAHPAAANRRQRCKAGVEHQRTVARTVRRGGKRRRCAGGSPCCDRPAACASAAPAHIAGRLTDPRRQRDSPARRSQVLARHRDRAGAADRRRPTGPDGRYRYTTTGTSSRTLRTRLPRLAADAALPRPRSACAFRPRARCT